MHNVAWHRLAGISRDISEKDVVWMAAYVAPKPAYINDAFTDEQITHRAMGTNVAPYHH